MSTVQLNHIEITNSPPHQKEIILIAENFIQMPSFGMLVRTAEAFGVKKVIFSSEEHTELTPKMKRRSCSAEKYVEVAFQKEVGATLQYYKENGYTILALERTNNSVELHQFKLIANKIVLIAGSERFGISKEALSFCDASVEIAMYGVNSSMNVVVATGIALQHLVYCK